MASYYIRSRYICQAEAANCHAHPKARGGAGRFAGGDGEVDGKMEAKIAELAAGRG